MRHCTIWKKAEKADNNIAITKDHTTRGCSLDKLYRVINQPRKSGKKTEQNCFTNGACDQQSVEAEGCKLKSKTQWYIPMGQEAIAFQVEAVAILNCVAELLKKKLLKPVKNIEPTKHDWKDLLIGVSNI